MSETEEHEELQDALVTVSLTVTVTDLSRFASELTMPRHVASVHIKNLADGVRHEDLRHAFGKFGRVIDVTVPVNYHTVRSCYFPLLLITFDDARDAEDAIYHMNHSRFAGREITVEFTRGTRKTPAEMRARDSGSRGRSWRSRSRSRSRSFRRRDRSSRDRSDSYSRRRGGSGRGGRQDDYRQSSRGRSYSRSADAENSTRRDDRESTKNGHWAEERGRRRRSRASSRELSRGSSRGGVRSRDGLDARSSPARRGDSRSSAVDRSPSRGGGSRSPSPSRGEEGFSQSPMRSRSISRGRSGSQYDANLSHDGFFRSEIQKTSDASLSLDLLLRCNKLKVLGATRDHLLAAVDQSKLLEVNASGTAIRRKTPINSVSTPTDCIVLVTGIPCFQSHIEDEEARMDQGTDELEAEEVEEGDEDDFEQSKSTVDGDQIENDFSVDMAAMRSASTIDWLKDQMKEFGLVKYINIPRNPLTTNSAVLEAIILIIEYNFIQLQRSTEISKALLHSFKTSGNIRGFGFVEFASKSAAKRAVSALAPTEKDLVCSSYLGESILVQRSRVGLYNFSRKEGRLSCFSRQYPGGGMDAEVGSIRYESKHKGTIGASIRVAMLLAAIKTGRLGLPQTLCCWLSHAESIGCRMYFIPVLSCLLHRGICHGTFELKVECIFQFFGTGQDRLITEGTETGVGIVRGKELRLLPYLDWLTWRPRFYAWLRAWTGRMRKRADRLIACAERKRRASMLHLPDDCHIETSTSTARTAVISPPMAEGVVSVLEEDKSQILALPGDFCPGTVVEVGTYHQFYFSSDLNFIKINSFRTKVYWPLDEELRQLDPRQQMRRVRAAIEHSILQPHRLLRSVAHFDTKPCDNLQPLEEIGEGTDHVSIPSTSQYGAIVRVFVRFREATEARTFACLLSHCTIGNGGDSSGGCFAWGSVLEGQRERAYCATIAAAKAGGAERRRRVQVAKRRRKVNQQHYRPSQPQKLTAPAVVDNGLPKPTRIVFDEEGNSPYQS
ncbi:unnamed protein product [Hydatigera taeniaeformis]|uniref:RRM domain-containing protein n=1 Tax=Hydatigena taeniaeformis TaxID=6205 RepID=A0A158RDT2_HYDTA|nr:unnamed protein product [Hydatigera taeniaeformis]